MFQNYQPHSEKHKRLFPNYYKVKEEAEEFDKSFRKSLTNIGRRMSNSIGVGKDDDDGEDGTGGSEEVTNIQIEKENNDTGSTEIVTLLA